MQEVPPDFIDMDLKEAEEPDPDSTKNQKELDERWGITIQLFVVLFM